MFHSARRHKLGFTLTEMAIVLAVVGVLAAGLWNLMSGANTQVRDESAASQQEQLIASVKAYLSSSEGMTLFLTGMGSSANQKLPLPSSAANAAGSAGCPGDANMAGPPIPPGAPGFCSYLPPGFWNGTTNSYGQNFIIMVQKDSTAAGLPPTTYSFMILTTGGSAIPAITDTSGARISSLIGNDGGFVYSSNVCNAAFATTACGSYGSWLSSVTGAGPAGFGFGAPAAPAYSGSIATRTYISPFQLLNNQWLARIVIPGDTTPPTAYHLNTMTTPEYLGGFALLLGKNIGGTVDLPPPSALPAGNPTGTIFMGNYTAAGPTAATGGFLEMQGGTVDFAYNGVAVGGGTMNVQGGNIYLQGGALDNNTAGTADLSTISLVGTGAKTVLSVTTNGTVGNVGVNLGTGCNKTSLNDATCNWALQLASGDETVSGLLQANALYSNTFIYGTLAPPSDIRLKTDIKPITHALDDIEKLKPVSFTMKKTGQPSYGVIAQDIQKIYPSLVVDSPDGFKAVLYDGLIGPLIGAVQELKQENDDLRKQISAQSVREDRLEQELKSRQAQ